jgi:hypothetical protein
MIEKKRKQRIVATRRSRSNQFTTVVELSHQLILKRMSKVKEEDLMRCHRHGL